MKIFIATSNKYYKTRLTEALGDKFDLTFMSKKKELMDILHSSFSSEFIEQGVDEGYPIVMLDYKMYKSIKLQQIFNNQEFFVSYFVLLSDAIEEVDIELVFHTNTALMIPVEKLTDNEIVFQLRLLTQNFGHIRKIQNHAWLDSLTQIVNRHTFMKNLDAYFDDYINNQKSFCLAMIDLDHFKLINDLFGHIKGDEVLSMLADIMKQNCRDTDILGRIGGEEFGIIFPKTKITHAYAVVERIRKTLEQTKYQDEHLYITMSAGVVLTNETHKSSTDLLENADLLLYKAKDLGRNTICKE